MFISFFYTGLSPSLVSFSKKRILLPKIKHTRVSLEKRNINKPISFATTFGFPVGFFPDKGGFQFQFFSVFLFPGGNLFFEIEQNSLSYFHVLYAGAKASTPCLSLKKRKKKRVERLELSRTAWKAATLPLSYTRIYKRKRIRTHIYGFGNRHSTFELCTLLFFGYKRT